jgi:predicted permease
MLWWRRKRCEDDLERELRADLELEAAEQQQKGLSAKEARHAARRAFGNTSFLKEEVRSMWVWTWWETLASDLRYALRAMRRNPGFSAAAIISLALGIGGNTAIFTLLNSILLKQLPVHDPARLVQLEAVHEGKAFNFFSWPVIEDLRGQLHSFSGVVAWSSRRMNVDTGSGPEPMLCLYATGNYYQVLGVHAILGRTLIPDDDRPGAPAVAVLSYAAWQARFGGDINVLGSTVRVERVPLMIVGVLPSWFPGTEVGESPDLIFPVSLQPQLMPDRPMLARLDAQWLRVVARLRDGVSEAQARAEVQAAWPRVRTALDPNGRKGLQQLGIDLTTASTGLSQLREEFSRPLFVIMGLVGLVLLMSCTNVANLLLARSTARGREMSVRLAIGAGRVRLLRQLLTESLLLAAIGSVVGTLVALEGSRALVSLLSGPGSTVVLNLWPDARVLAFTVIVTLITGVLFGLAPALQATAPPSRRGQRRWLAQVFVVTQIAVCLVLVTGAGLFVRSLQKLLAVDTGFRREGLLLVSVNPGRAGYRGDALIQFYGRLQERLNTLPEVRASSVSVYPPVQGNGGTFFAASTVLADGRPSTNNTGFVYLNVMGPRFFETLGTPLIQGREFGPADTSRSARVVVISKQAASDYFGTVNAIGHHIQINNGPAAEVVGVAEDVKYETLRERPHRVIYEPYSQDAAAAGAVYVELRTRTDSLSPVIGEVRRELHALAPQMPIETITFTSWLDQFLVRERLVALLSAGFGIIAVLLAAVGLYGLMACTVAQRTRELGIRMALGAQHSSIRWQVIRESLLLAAGGIVIGLPIVLAAGRLISNLLYGLNPDDPLTFGLACMLLLSDAMLAGYIPARRASRIDPMVSLRYE